MDAQIIVSVLQGSEVPAFVFDDNICRLYPQAALLVGGVKVLVSTHDAERAAEVLQGVDDAESPLTGQILPVPLSVPAAIITMFRSWLNRKRNEG